MLSRPMAFPHNRRRFLRGVAVAGFGLVAGCGRLPLEARL